MTEQKKRLERLSGVKGMNDILPQDAALWDFFETTVKSMLRAYGYQNIRTPIVEHTQLFTRGIGEVTDIVEKEMYSFTDALNGEHLTMRPENTAAVVRAVIEHNLLYDGPKRLWYVGPMFRHERPQRGRYRQFHQVGKTWFPGQIEHPPVPHHTADRSARFNSRSYVSATWRARSGTRPVSSPTARSCAPRGGSTGASADAIRTP